MSVKQQVVTTWTCDHCGCHTQKDPMGGYDGWGVIELDRTAGHDAGPSDKTRNELRLLLCGPCFDHFDPIQHKDWKP